MSIFDNVIVDSEAVEAEEKVGGESKFINKTGEYDMIIKYAYGVQSMSSNAVGVYIKFVDEDGRELNETIYISYRDGKTFKIDENGNKREHFGFTRIKRMNEIITGKAEMPRTEKKLIPVWNRELGKEVPTEKDVLVDWIGQPVTLLLKAVKKYKQARMDDGSYADTDKVITEMKIDHVLDPFTKKTAAETRNGSDAILVKEWHEKNPEDSVWDQTNKKVETKTSKGAGSEEGTGKGLFS